MPEKTIEESTTQITRIIAADVAADGWIRESSQELNAWSSELVDAYRREYGAAWLGVINIYREREGQPVIVSSHASFGGPSTSRTPAARIFGKARSNAPRGLCPGAASGPHHNE